MPSQQTREAAAAAGTTSSPFLLCVPAWEWLASAVAAAGGIIKNSSRATEFYITCASGAEADIQFYIVRFATMDMSILRIAQRAEFNARLEFFMTLVGDEFVLRREHLSIEMMLFGRTIGFICGQAWKVDDICGQGGETVKSRKYVVYESFWTVYVAFFAR